jgi:hypothetical protein
MKHLKFAAFVGTYIFAFLLGFVALAYSVGTVGK